MGINVFVFFIFFFSLCYFAEKRFFKRFGFSERGNRKRMNKLFLLFLLFFVLLYVFRDFKHASDDTNVYVSSFVLFGKTATLLNYYLQNGHPNFEKGYMWLIYAVTRITINPRWFMFIIALFIYTSILLFLFRASQRLSSKNMVLTIVMFVISGMFFSSTNLQRQYIALSIILFSYEYLYEKKIIKFYLLVLLASLFHHSSLICCFLPLIFFVKINKITISLYIALIFVIFLYSTTIVTWVIKNISYFSEYKPYIKASSHFVDVQRIKVGPLSLFLIALMFLVFLYNTINFSNYYQVFLFKLYSCGIIFLASSIHFSLTDRMSTYFIPTMFPLFANAPKKLPFYVCFFIQFIFCLFVNTLRKDWTMFFPYRFM